jgi:hypothetical protein
MRGGEEAAVTAAHEQGKLQKSTAPSSWEGVAGLSLPKQAAHPRPPERKKRVQESDSTAGRSQGPGSTAGRSQGSGSTAGRSQESGSTAGRSLGKISCMEWRCCKRTGRRPKPTMRQLGGSGAGALHARRGEGRRNDLLNHMRRAHAGQQQLQKENQEMRAQLTKLQAQLTNAPPPRTPIPPSAAHEHPSTRQFRRRNR